LPLKRKNQQWFDRLTILSEVEGSRRNDFFFSVQLQKSWLIQKKFADLRYERKGFIALLAPASS